jgi:Na+/proline symporter
METKAWMWINETVFSCVMCYNYGIAAPMWYGTALSFQVATMAMLGVLSKLRVPHAHTSLEIVRRRYGNVGHVVFTCLNLINNIFGCSSMILAGSQLVVGISGMHIVAATILLPFGGTPTPVIS